MVAVLKAMYRRCFAGGASILKGQRKGRKDEVRQHRRGGPDIAARMKVSAFNSVKDWPAGAIAAVAVAVAVAVAAAVAVAVAAEEGSAVDEQREEACSEAGSVASHIE